MLFLYLLVFNYFSCTYLFMYYFFYLFVLYFFRNDCRFFFVARFAFNCVKFRFQLYGNIVVAGYRHIVNPVVVSWYFFYDLVTQTQQWKNNSRPSFIVSPTSKGRFRVSNFFLLC